MLAGHNPVEEESLVVEYINSEKCTPEKKFFHLSSGHDTIITVYCPHKEIHFASSVTLCW